MHRLDYKRLSRNGPIYGFSVTVPARAPDEPDMTRDQRRFLRAHDTLARTPGGLDALGREQAAVAIALLQQAEAEQGLDASPFPPPTPVLERILFSALPKLFSFLVALTAGIVLLTLGVAMGLLFLFAILFVFVRTVGKGIKTTECNPRRRCR